ncbi:unnamed protein product [Auanema sp. JU1783]|nr:unnamed protein product [Auanema sp. JU1783]
MAVNGPLPDDFMRLPSDFLMPIKPVNSTSFAVLDQTKLPLEIVYENVSNVKGGCDAIKTMKVRGAPAIATVALRTVSCELQAFAKHHETMQSSDIEGLINSVAQQLIACRPTAIDLMNAMSQVCKAATYGATAIDKVAKIQEVIDSLLDAEIEQNRVLVWNGYQEVLSTKPEGHQFTIMTICNTGTLATSSWGTALGVIYALFRNNKLKMVYALETRPYYQGLRLTATELSSFGVPFKVIPDGAAASAMRKFKVDAVLTGVDQVTLNGDFANKIGTYALSIAAKEHGIPFYPVVPRTSVNLNRYNGDEIVIEERPSKEMLAQKDVYIAPAETPVWNPAFDVTPAPLITKFITDFGNFKPEEIKEAVKILKD